MSALPVLHTHRRTSRTSPQADRSVEAMT